MSRTPARIAETAAARRPVSRRRFLRLGMVAAAGGVAALGAYAFWIEPRRVEVTRRTFPVAGLPPELDGLRLVQLTDIHLGPWTSLGFVRDVVRRANALDADLFVLTGDFVHKSGDYADPVAEALSELRPRIGTAAVLGNHDWWEGADSVRRALVARGLPVIDNDRILVTPDRRIARTSDSGLCIAGVGDLWEDRCLFDRALDGVPPGVPRIVLSHNPDAAEEGALVRGGHRVDLMLSGHTHGGQVWVPGLAPARIPSRFGAKYASGIVRGPACWVYVSRGIGVTGLPLRFAARPEIAAIDLARLA